MPMGFGQAQREFVEAARRLQSAWEALPPDEQDEAGVGYPKGLPSFDEFVCELAAWANREVE